MELTELQEIINRHGKNLKQEVGLALSEQEAKDIIKYAVSEVFSLHVVSNWVAIESDEQPERVTDVMVKYKDNRKEVAFFDGDGRFYTQNDDDITDKIASWHKLP
jgi:hypothetical protein